MKLACRLGLHDWTDWIPQVRPAGWGGYLWKMSCRDCGKARFLDGMNREWSE